jgi:hypothetical protein
MGEVHHHLLLLIIVFEGCGEEAGDDFILLDLLG